MEAQRDLDHIFPILEELQSSVSMIEERVTSFVPRKHITDTVKQRHPW